MRKIEPAPSPREHFTNPEGLKRLSKIVFDPKFNELINEVNEKYHYWDKVKHIPVPDGISREEVWAVAKIRRMNTPFRIHFGEHEFTWFLNGRIQAYLHFLDMNIGGSLEARSLIPKDEKNRYLVSSIMEEAIASSQIEGAVTTRKVAKEMLRKNRPPRNTSEQMIVNNYLTIQKILKIKDDDLTIEKLLDIHRIVSAKTIGDEHEGQFRNSNDINVVDTQDGEIVHAPPDQLKIKPLINDLCSFFNNDSEGQFIHPIIKGCIIHFMIGFIHPFVDGNGRTARALFYWYLLKKGYWLTEYMSISKLILKSKAQYARAYLYTEKDDNDLTYFILYKLRTMKLAFDSLREYIQRKLEEKRQVAEFIKIANINDRQALILKWYYEEPSLLLTVKEIQNRLHISNQTARTDLQGLVGDGFLDVIKLNLKKEAFIKSQKFDALLKDKVKRQQRNLFDQF